LEDQAVFLEILGLEEYRVRCALNLYQQGVGTLGYVADPVGISKQFFIPGSTPRPLRVEM
jgi:hypothetical protein